MNRPDEYIETRLYLSPKQLAVLDETIARAREEIADLKIDRQMLFELLMERYLEDLENDGVVEELRFWLSIGGVPGSGGDGASGC